MTSSFVPDTNVKEKFGAMFVPVERNIKDIVVVPVTEHHSETGEPQIEISWLVWVLYNLACDFLANGNYTSPLFEKEVAIMKSVEERMAKAIVPWGEVVNTLIELVVSLDEEAYNMDEKIYEDLNSVMIWLFRKLDKEFKAFGY